MGKYLSFSERESDRLGLRVFRSHGFSLSEVHEFFIACANSEADLVILRAECELINSLFPMLRASCHTLVADSLLEFSKSLRPDNIADFLNSGADIVEAQNVDTGAIAALIRRCYADYTNHYHANPCINKEGILAGLTEFSLSFLDAENKTMLLAVHRGSLVGYLCLEIRDDIGSTVIGGSALDIPITLRHKVLCDLTHHGDRWLMERGIKRFVAVTRTEKIYIQKLLYHNMHALPTNQYNTLHLNLFFHQTAMQPPKQPTAWPPALCAQIDSISYTRFELRPGVHSVFEHSLVIAHQDENYRYAVQRDSDGIQCFTFVNWKTSNRVSSLYMV